MSDFDWSSFLLSQLWIVPYMMVYFVGSVLCVVHWRRHPMVSILSLAAFVILMGNTVIGSGVQWWQMAAIRDGSAVQDIRQILGIVGAIRTLFSVVAWVLLLIALFGWRAAPATGR